MKNATQPLSSWIVPTSELETLVDGNNQITSGTNDEGAKQIRNIFGFKAFDYAKPVSLIRELVRQCTGPDDWILDFFAGSATTAQAIIELNAEDGARRRFIMTSSTEATEAEPTKNLCQSVTAERIRRLNENTVSRLDGLTAGFAYLRARKIPFEDLDYDLEPADAWAALETIHRLPLTAYDAERPWNYHASERVTLVLVDRYEKSLIDWLRNRDRQNLFVYCWAPGQIAELLDGVEIDIRSVRETLIKRFQQ